MRDVGEINAKPLPDLSEMLMVSRYSIQRLDTRRKCVNSRKAKTYNLFLVAADDASKRA